MANKASKIALAAEQQIESGFSVSESPSQTSVPASAPSANNDLRAHIGKTVAIPLDRLFIKDNIRQTIKKDADFKALVASIAEGGVLQNLTGEVMEDGRMVAIVSGQRRFLAASEAGIPKVYVRLTAFESQGKRIAHGLVENLLREDLNAIDTADAFASLIEEGWEQQVIAAQFNRSEQTIRKYLQIASWPDTAKNLVRENLDVFPVVLLFNQISKAEHEDHDLLLAKLRNILRRARETEAEQHIPSKQRSIAAIDPLNQQREHLLKQLLGTKVVVSQKSEGKPIRVTLNFKDQDAFDVFTRKLQD
jgi:ParB family transcriptional regulator, chromosome partitioning protein